MRAANEASDAEFPYRATLNLLGGYLLVRCRYSACRDGIAEYFSSAVVDQPWRTPDVIIDCDWPNAGRYLFRARPDDHPDPVLRGVRVHVRGAQAVSDWASLEPPIPPMSLDPYAGRFVGLHAGAVVTPSGDALAFVGDKQSGKTTTTVRLVNEHGCRLLTDEAVFLHRRTRVVEPFPRSLGIADTYDQVLGELKKVPRPASVVCREVASQPAMLACLGFLTPTPGLSGVSLEPLSATDALRLMLPNHFNVSASADEGMVTLMGLARDVPAVRCRYGSYQDLLNVAGMLLAYSDRQSAAREAASV